MRKFYCDICGAPLSEERVNAILDRQEASLCEEHMKPERSAAEAACPSVRDLCEGCEAAGRNIDVESMVLAEWGRLIRRYGEKKAGTRRTRKVKGEGEPKPKTGRPAKEQPPEPPTQQTGADDNAQAGRTVTQTPLSISADSAAKQGPGSHWAKKKYIHTQLMMYRKQTGLGTLPKLAELSGVSTETIRQMIESAPVPIEQWRMLGGALDKLGIIPPDAGQAQ